MAKIVRMTYARLSKQRVDQFENERVEATAELEPGDKPAMVMQNLKRFVDAQLGLGPSEFDLREAKRIVEEYGEFNVNELFVEAEPKSRKTR